MAHRLVINIENDGKLLANAYYHDSSFTSQAIKLVRSILTAWGKQENHEPTVENAVMVLYATGAGFYREEIRRMDADLSHAFDGIPKHAAVGTEQKALAVTEEGIMENREWAEYEVFIDIARNVVDFGVFTKCDAQDFALDYGREAYEALPQTDSGDFAAIAFAIFEDFAQFVHQYADGVRDEDGSVILWKE